MSKSPDNTATCGACLSSYGHCRPGADGKPIFCRCPKHPDRYLMCTGRACGDFLVRGSPLPGPVTKDWSENREAEQLQEKVVPLFRPGKRKPWKVVLVSTIPAGKHLNSDGEFV